MLTNAMVKAVEQAPGKMMGGSAAMMKAMAGSAGLTINPMTQWIADAYLASVFFYVCGLAALVLSREKSTVWLLSLGLAANLVSLGLRLATQWPMQAPYQGPFWLSACLAALILYLLASHRAALGKALVPLLVFFNLLAFLFPGDSYVPYLRSNTITAHLSLLLISASKAVFVASGEVQEITRKAKRKPKVMWVDLFPKRILAEPGNSFHAEIVRGWAAGNICSTTSSAPPAWRFLWKDSSEAQTRPTS